MTASANFVKKLSKAQYFLSHLSILAVSKAVNLSEERVRQIEHKTLKKLRNLEATRGMRDYLN